MEQSCKFKIKAVDYIVNKPMIGDLIAIEENKAVFTNGRYKFIMNNGTTVSEKALDDVDMMAVITALCPLLISNLKVDSWKKLSIEDFSELRNVYNSTIKPWFLSVIEPMKGNG